MKLRICFLLPSHSWFWLVRWFPQTPRPIIITTIIITVTKLLELVTRPGQCAGSFFAWKILPVISVFQREC